MGHGCLEKCQFREVLSFSEYDDLSTGCHTTMIGSMDFVFAKMA